MVDSWAIFWIYYMACVLYEAVMTINVFSRMENNDFQDEEEESTWKELQASRSELKTLSPTLDYVFMGIVLIFLLLISPITAPLHIIKKLLLG